MDWKKQFLLMAARQLGANKSKKLGNKYLKAFPASYIENHSPAEAVKDILHIEKITAENRLEVHLYTVARQTLPLHLKLYHFEKPMPLSDSMPIIENMGLRTFTERPYQLRFPDKTVWINDFNVVSARDASAASLKKIKKITTHFEEDFYQICQGKCENDGFNRLVITAGLTWREVAVIRAYAKYLLQIGFRFSQNYIESVLEKYPEFVQNLIAMFTSKFALVQESSQKKMKKLQTAMDKSLEAIPNLDEDLILRSYSQLIHATLRTNYYQTTGQGSYKDYISFKLNAADVPNLPTHRPMFEIFVYSPSFEGIHLRSSKVARGGLRWSDRLEDYRTEVLGLMKAQVVKNAIIVPSGAKGGFVLKKVPLGAPREFIQQEVARCYQLFIRGLLDLTDNLKNNKIVPPPDLIAYDEADPYFVVAADKGTATFSDLANSIAQEYDFWLGDAFASGGSSGYDHKKMGITARGVWECIKRQFSELNINVEEENFTAVGVGDMSGDVFGNGALYTPHMRLIAAFDHRHIFVDPNPDAKLSYQERHRLFHLPISSWADYNPEYISEGGGVFPRTSKSIKITSEMKQALGILEDSLTPNELMQAILKAPVDLLYNGGIGTYVKASSESNSEVGDKNNDYCRVNGKDLRCKVVGEGGNLGFTQLARIEYALAGGLIFTDFIDNAGGVNCSDNEVNIKILLNKEMAKGTLTLKKRNQLLAKMTSDVAHKVLQDNYNQALIMSLSAPKTLNYASLYHDYLRSLEMHENLDREVEFLPDDKKLLERNTAGQGLTRPELAVLIAYTKIYIANALLKSSLPDDPWFNYVLEQAFPNLLVKNFKEAVYEHPLRREIIATQLANQIVNMGGLTFVYRFQSENSASVAEIVKAFAVTLFVYRIEHAFKMVQDLNFKIPLAQQYELMYHLRRLLNLSTRWFLRKKRLEGSIQSIATYYAEAVAYLKPIIPKLISGVTKDYFETLVMQFQSKGIPVQPAREIATSRVLYTALNVAEVAKQHEFDLHTTVEIYLLVGSQFNLVWFRDRIANDLVEGYWQGMARLVLRDELDNLQRRLTIDILSSHKNMRDSKKLIKDWVDNHAQLCHRWESILETLHRHTAVNHANFFTVLKELADMLDTL